MALGDAGKGNTAQRDVAIAMRDVCAAKGCDFALLLGDNIYDAGVDSVTDAQWQTKFELPYKDLNIPFYPTLGNHDNSSDLGEQIGAGGERDHDDVGLLRDGRAGHLPRHGDARAGQPLFDNADGRGFDRAGRKAVVQKAPQMLLQQDGVRRRHAGRLDRRRASYSQRPDHPAGHRVRRLQGGQGLRQPDACGAKALEADFGIRDPAA